jgi:hypothetical protein
MLRAIYLAGFARLPSRIVRDSFTYLLWAFMGSVAVNVLAFTVLSEGFRELTARANTRQPADVQQQLCRSVEHQRSPMQARRARWTRPAGLPRDRAGALDQRAAYGWLLFGWRRHALARYRCRLTMHLTSSASAGPLWAASRRSRVSLPHGDWLRCQRVSADEHAAPELGIASRGLCGGQLDGV